ncbi:cupin domain-containing protein [soil metagenome]
MTQLEELYTQPNPEKSAWFRSAKTAPDLVRGGGNQAHYLATGGATGGLYGLYKWEMGAGPVGADPHFHRTFSEAFYILSGTVQLFDGNEWIDGIVGDFVHVPPGGIHAFRNHSGGPASMLIHFAPGAPREDYFNSLDRLSEMSTEERAAFFVEHDNLYPPS